MRSYGYKVFGYKVLRLSKNRITFKPYNPKNLK